MAAPVGLRAQNPDAQLRIGDTFELRIAGVPADQVSQVALLNHLHRLGGSGLHVVFEHRHAELVRHRLDRGEIEGLGDGGDDALEEQALDDLGAVHAQAIG